MIMESLYLLIPLSVMLAIFFGILLWWSSHSGQFDDLEGPAHRILQDDDTIHPINLSPEASQAGQAEDK
jgi:cbb3-type cytochrome oxidase maturation protein